jgi:hypothetical protein
LKIEFNALVDKLPRLTRATKRIELSLYLLIATVFVVLISFVGVNAFHIFQHIVAEQVCPLPASPTVINNQLTVTPDNVDGVINCSLLDINIGPTGEVIFDRKVTANNNPGDDWGVTLLVNNLTIQAGGKINANGKGYTVLENESSNGTGGSSAGQTGGAGGGYGGAGGQGIEEGSNASGYGGQPYGSQETPKLLGSAGGSGGINSNFSKTWTSNADFNAGSFSSGLVNPATNNDLRLNNNETINNAYTDPVSTGLAGYWKLDESSGNSAADSSANNNNGTVSGALVTQGKKGNSRQFNGSSNFISIPDANSLDFTASFTLSAWIYQTTAGGTGYRIIDKQTAGGDGTGYELDTDGDASGRRLRLCLPSDCISANTQYQLNTWNYVVVTFNNGTVTFYLNGTQDGSTISANTASVANALDLRIGAPHIGCSNACGLVEYFNGSIDEVQTYSRQLTQAEITQNFDYGNLLLYLKMDEASWNGTSGEVSDSSGNSLNSTSFNGATTGTGKFNSAGIFDGTNDYVDVGAPAGLSGTDSHTISAWLKLDSSIPVGESRQAIVKGSDLPSGGWGMLLGVVNSGGTLQWYCSVVTTSPVAQYSANGGTISTGVWYHVVNVFDNVNHTVKLYVNGQLINTTATGSNLRYANSSFIGQDVVADKHWPGAVDEVRIYSLPLSGSDIGALYVGTGNYQTGEQTWTSNSLDAGTGNTYTMNKLSADWTLDGTDNVAPKFQLLASNTGSFSGEETIFPAGTGTYYQSGTGHPITSGAELNISTEVTTGFRYWKVKALVNTGSDVSDTPVVSDITLKALDISGATATGGSGGGAVKILASGSLTLDGTITANGNDGVSNGTTSGGGGSGGSVWIEANSFAGSGDVSAKGGTAPATSFQGGGGGGGRILMFCTASNTFSGTVDVSGGVTENSQDGGIGTKLGPTCRPNAPTILKQFKTNETTEIGIGGITTENSIVFVSNMSDVDNADTLSLQIEVRALGTPFTGVPTNTQVSAAPNPRPCLTPTSDCGRIVVTGMATSTEYHWQARIRDNKGGFSAWVSFGANAESARDVLVTGSPHFLSLISGNSQTGVVYTNLAALFTVKVTDISSFPVPGYTISWNIVNSGNGGFMTTGGTSVTDVTGTATGQYKLGKNTGSNNNVVQAIASGLVNNPLLFVASATPDQINHFTIQSPQVAIVGQNFDTVTITAYDQYDNKKTDYAGSPTLSPVDPLNTNITLSGSLQPASISFAPVNAGVKSLSNVSYDTQQSIKIKVADGTAVGYSNSIAVVTTLGSCPDVDGLIDTNETWTATTGNVGIFDCRGLTVHITSSAVLSLAPYDNGDGDWTNDYGTTILADNIIVDNGSSISSNAAGYGYARGPGSAGGGAAGYGGYGYGAGAPYGNVYEPYDMGSGGEYAGGGAIKLVVTGETEVNGTVSVDGGNSTDCHYGGATGGSIWIDTATFSGDGVVHSNGGRGWCGGNGASGGRVSVYYTNNGGAGAVFSLTDRGHIQAFGGPGGWCGSCYGGAGTVYVEHRGADPIHGGRLYVDNQNVNTFAAALPQATYQFTEINLTRTGHLDVLGNGSILTVTDGSSLTGDSSRPNLTVFGTFNGPSGLNLNGVNLGIHGEVQLGNNNANSTVTVGDTLAGGFSLYGSTWAHPSGSYTFGTIDVKGNGLMQLIGNDNGDGDWSNDNGINLGVTNLNIEQNGYVSSDSMGYSRYHGPGNTGGGAAAHGGYGYGGAGAPYDSVYEPTGLGSAGEYSGGGAVKLAVADQLTVNGTMSLNGGDSTDCHWGGASGGSLWIEADAFGGNGLIRTNGGRGWCGGSGGAGGRISVYYNTNGGTSSAFALTDRNHIQSYGGPGGWCGSCYGGPGTVYIEHKGADPVHGARLYVDNQNVNTNQAALLEGSYQFEEINLNRTGHLDVLGQGSVLTITDGNALTGDATKPRLTLYGTLIAPAALNINGVDVGINGEITLGNNTAASTVTIGNTLSGGLTLYANTWAHTTGQYAFGNMNVDANGVLTLVGYNNGDSNWTNDFGITLTTNNTSVASGGYINLDGLGYGRYFGAGNTGGGAAAYGGYGYGGAGTPYGDVYQPTDLGSAGEYSGGGAVKFAVNNELFVDGTISSNGSNSFDCHWGGASGGSIWIDAGTISGGGLIRTDGAHGWCGGTGGAGGRIAVYYNQNGGTNPAFALTDRNHIQSYGGSGGWCGGCYGGPGTVYVEHKGVDVVHGARLYIDNQNVNTNQAALPEATYQFSEINLTRTGNLDVLGANSVVTVTDSSSLTGDASRPRLTIYGLFNGPSSFAINGIDLGIIGDINLGNDTPASNVTIGNTLAGGLTLYADHGVDLARGKPASESSNYANSYPASNCNDGNLNNLCVTNNELAWWQVDLQSSQLIGSVKLWNRGDCCQDRVSNFKIEISTTGNFSGEQTLVYQATNQQAGRPSVYSFPPITGRYVRITLTQANYLNLTDIAVYKPSAASASLGGFDFGNVTVSSAGALTFIGYDNGDGDWTNDFGVTFGANNLTIANGGYLNADGTGYGRYRGPGNTGGGAAAHGGFGYGGAGTPYDSVYQPSVFGSGGENSGGGSVKLNIAGELRLDGGISANGVDSFDCHWGGASGGSIWIDANVISGAGYARTNGGHGWCGGTGGAGGRIAVYYNTNGGNGPVIDLSSRSHLQSFGGSGGWCGGCYGGPGTVYVEHKGVDTVHAARLYVDNQNVNTNQAALTEASYQFAQIDLQRTGNLDVLGNNSVLTISDGNALTGDSSKPRLTVYGTFVAPSNLALSGVDVGILGELQLGGDNTTSSVSVGNGQAAGLTLYPNTWAHTDGNYHLGDITINGNGSLTLPSYDNGDGNWTNDFGVNLQLNNLTVLTGGYISGDAAGYSANRGPGAGYGSYGGYGYGQGVPSYGSYSQPTDLGSGGGGAPAGGALKLTIDNDFSFDGTVSVNGGGGYGCHQQGSSGGSIWIVTNVLKGSGLLRSNGGGGQCGGNGASGGRIAVYYSENGTGGTPFVFDNNHVQAFGGPGGWCGGGCYGGPGTIYYEHVGVDSPGSGSLRIDNQSVGGTRAMDFLPQDYNLADLYIGPNVYSLMKTDTTTLTAGHSYPAVPSNHEADANTIALWHLDEVTGSGAYLKDASNNGHDATPYGTTSIQGLLKNGRSTGSGEVLSFTDIPLTTDWTIELALKFPLPSTPDGWRTVIAHYGGTYHHIIVHQNGDLGVYNNGFYDSGYNVNSLSGWHHIALVGAAGSTVFYVDGTNVGSVATQINQPVSAIGNYAAGGGQFAGSVDEVRISNIALTQGQIAARDYQNSDQPYQDYQTELNSLQQFIQGRGVVFNLTGNFFLGAGAFLDGRYQGFSTDFGIGKGQDGAGQSGGGGGAYGGNGGSGESDGGNPATVGGNAYGSQSEPLVIGSGGGRSGPGTAGGKGGGAIAIRARTGNVQMDPGSSLDVSGEVGHVASPGGGGGAGGSILIEGQTCALNGTINAQGGNGGNEAFDGGGGGGGRISILYTSGPCSIAGAVSVAFGTSAGGQSGQVGTYPAATSIPSVPTFSDQFKSDASTQIPVGGRTQEQEVVLKVNVSDPGASVGNPKTLAAQFEVVPINQSFVGASIYHADSYFAQSNINNNKSQVLGISTSGAQVYSGGSPLIAQVAVPGLTPGQSYKWRARIQNATENINSYWTDFGSNGSNQADFVISTVNSLAIGVNKTNVNIGESITVTVAAKNSSNVTDPTYNGTVTFNSDSLTAVVPANFTYGIAQGGTHDFTDELIFTEAGNYTVTVRDTLNNSLIATSVPITVNAAAATDTPTPTTGPGTPTVTPSETGTPTPTTGPGTPTVTPVETATPSSAGTVGPLAENCSLRPNTAYCQQQVKVTNVVVTDIDEHTVKVCWHTNIETIGSIGFGLASSGLLTETTGIETTYAKDHCQTVTNLDNSSGYVFKIDANSQAGKQGVYSDTFATKGGAKPTPVPEPKQCITQPESNQYSFNDQHQAILEFDTAAEGTCSVHFGNDTSLPFTTGTDDKALHHQAIINLQQTDGKNDILYQISCNVDLGGATGKQCTNNGVIPVSRYSKYYQYPLPQPLTLSQIITQQVVPVALVLTSVATVAINLFAYPRLILFAITWLKDRRKYKPWGIVYDAKTRKPIAFAAVRIYLGNLFIKEKIADLNGKYGLALDAGTYRLVVEHPEYKKEEQEITIKQNDAIITEDIAMTLLHEAKGQTSKLRKQARKYFHTINTIMVYGGFAFSIVITILAPVLFNFIIVGLYLLQFGVVRILENMNRRHWGYLYDVESDSRLSGAFVRLFDPKETRQIDVQMTDERGRYGFAPDPSEYNLSADIPGFNFPSGLMNQDKIIRGTGRSFLKVDARKGKIIDLALPLDPKPGSRKGEQKQSPFGT